ncbi:hypothetical protein Tco_0569531 [Tanacetum coccineum]
MYLFEEDNCRCGTCSSYFPNVTSLTQHISLVHNEVKSDDEFVVPVSFTRLLVGGVSPWRGVYGVGVGGGGEERLLRSPGTCRLKLKYKGANPKLLDQSSSITISASHVRSRGGAIMEFSNYAQVAQGNR